MAKTVNIKLSSSTGSSTGPTFDLFSDANSYASAFESGVSKTTLMGVGGYTSTVVPDAATIIRVKSVGTCTTYDDFTLASAPTATPTPTPTPTLTPTPTPTLITEGVGVTITNCVKLTRSSLIAGESCSTDSYRTYTVTLYDSTGGTMVTATSDVTVTLNGTDGGDPATWSLIIGAGESSAFENIFLREQLSGDCGDRDGMVIRSVSGISTITPSNVAACPTVTPTPGVTLYNFYRAGEVELSSYSSTYCSTGGYLINGPAYSTKTFSDLAIGDFVYTDVDYTPLVGLGTSFRVAISSTSDTNTNNVLFKWISINANGEILNLGTYSCASGNEAIS